MTLAKDIAVIGRSCRLPGAPSVNDLWRLLESGTCAVTRVPDDRWAMERMSHPRNAERGRSYTWAAGTLDDIWGFDPAAFGLSPREAEQMDPQQRLLLELSWEALEDAGMRPSRLAGSDTGVFIGASALDYGNLRIIDASAGDAYLMTGNTLSIISNRISYIFDLHGPSFTVDTACSSALVALNEAVVSLRSGRIDTAIVGGVNILASPFNFIGFSQAAMLSRTGLCQAFAAGADGYVRAEGGVVLVLRTREAAERAGDHIHGFIAGSDVNSDGRTNGISLPSKAYQAKLLETLYVRQGIDPNGLAFVEAHGTGTRVGDPIEATAIGEVLAQKRHEPLLIGSIKTNIGHMEAASGLGGFLKAMLALEHDALPASLHSADLNPDIDFEALNLKVARELTALPRRSGARRLAGINSFGFGGTNAHVIIADGPEPEPRPVEASAKPDYLVISAHSRAALGALVADYAARLDHADDDEARTVVSAAAYHRERLAHRVVVPMTTRQDLVATLDRLADEEQDAVGAVRATAIDRETPVAFVFSGNGSQFVGMGLAAYAHSAHFRAELDSISEDFSALAGWSIVETLHDTELAAKLELTQIAQPLLYAVQAATFAALRAGGLEPSMVLGHSVGEVAAAEAAGILDRAGALKTIFARSLHQELTFGCGGMAVVIGSREATEQILKALPSLEIAALNSPRAFTVSGLREEIDQLSVTARPFKARIRKLDLAYPFHNALMAPVERPLLRSLADLKPQDGVVPFISTVSGERIDGRDLDAHYWWRNVREPVQFSAAIEAATKAGARIFVEIGPQASLLSHIGDCIDEHSATIATLCALDKKDRGDDPIVQAIAVALARGAAVDEDKAFGPRPAPGTRIDLPAYPWQRKTYRLADSVESPGLVRAGAWHPLIGARLTGDRLEWHSTLDTALYPWLADHCVDGRAILPGAAFAEMALAVARDWLGSEEATIADLEISSPMILTPDASREVVCRLSPLINHIEIVSRPRLGQTPWQTHATAKIVRDAAVTLSSLDDHATVAGSHVITGAEIYAMAARAGLQYGPAFQKLTNAVASRPDRISLNLTAEPANPLYGVDPARMDACFHALVLIFSSLREAVHGTAYIPVRFGEIMLRRPGATFTRARIDVLRRDERIIVANFFLLDDEGDIVVFMREARFQAIRTARVSDASKQMIVETALLASEPTAARNDRPLAVSVLRRGTMQSRDAMTSDFVLLEGWATALALNTARELATAGFIDAEALVETGRLPAKARPWLEDLLVSLDRSGLSHRDKLGRHVDPDVALPHPDEILRTIAAEHQNLGAELLVAASVDAAVNALVAGDFDTFLKPLPKKAMDGWELGGSQAHAAAETLIDLFRRSKPHWPKDRAMRILQVGYGPLTGLAVALAEDSDARLTIFDPDRRRLERARMAHGGHADIAFLDASGELPASAFDFVIAAHALFHHKRDSALWSALRRSMARGAIFAAIEPPPSFFRDLVLGLEARLSDEAAAAGFDGLSVSEADWLETMQAVSLGDPEVLSITTSAGAALLLTAQVDSERRHWSGSGNALIIGGSDARGTETTSAFATLLASSGLHVSIMLDSEDPDPAVLDKQETIVVFASASDADVAPAKSLLDQCMRLKRLADAIGNRKVALWVVVPGDRGRGPADAQRGTDVATGLWAFTRTLANEMPTLDVRRVELAALLRPDMLAERLRDLVLSKTDETEIVLGETATHVTRFVLGAPQERGQGKKAEAARLARGDGSGIDRIHWEPATRQAPGASEVEIAVEAVGLNFRDVMFGLGVLPEDILEHGFAGPTLGLECAGRVERVGSAVKGLKPGDRVMAFARNAFATHVTTPAAVVAPIPHDMPFEMAATIPVTFLTAYHALMLCARLKPAEWVLIHGGAGGVGLAALQIARWRGARVIATAGSPEKRALLVSLGAEHVFDSRSGAFVEDVRAVTGEGVAVVVNSLSGEAMERSIGVLKPFGRFVELGKRDYVANTHVGLRPFRRNLSYFGVDLDQLLIGEPTTSKLLMRSVLGLFAKGALTPLPYRAFAATETVEAFRLMQQSAHIGKLVVKPPRPQDIIMRQRRSFSAASDKIHLVTGGFSGFGLETARWLAERGARHLLLIGRSGAASQTAREALAAFAAKGVRVRTEAMDIGDKAAVQRLFARFGKDLPALGGIVHAAMVLDDATVPNLTAEAMERVLRPKVAGADILDQLSRDLSLDYFVLYSSATTLIGNPGQAAYVAANGYLEGLARRRRAAGLPALAIAWGAIEDVGVLARSASTRDALASRVGIKGMLAQDALRLLGEVLGMPQGPEDAVVAIAPINWSAARQHLAVLRGPSYKALTSQGEAKASDQNKIDIASLVAKHTPDEARKVVSGLIVDEIARVLRLPREDIAKTVPLAEIGLDSLMAVELALGLEERFALKAPLSTTASSLSANELADHVIGLATGTLSGDDAIARSMMERHLGPAADAGTLSVAAEIVKKGQEAKSLLP